MPCDCLVGYDEAGFGEKRLSLSAAKAVILKKIDSPIKTRVIYFLYRLLLFLFSPLLVLYFLLRIRRDRRYLRHFRERLGFLPGTYEPTAAGAIWLHAVSVGEVISAIPLVAWLRREYPNAPVFVSCATVAGRAIAEEKLAPKVTGLFYAPIDYVSCVRRTLRRIQPSLVIVMETEIWPNVWREVKRSGSALAVVNGRISDRAFPKYKPWRTFFEAVLCQPDLLLVQTEEDRRRYVEIGAPVNRVETGGNLKYDFNPGEGAIPDAVAAFLDRLRPGRIVIAASTMPGLDAADVDEDDIVIGEYAKLAARYRDLLLVLVPRRPERFAVAAAKLAEAGVPFVRRSELATTSPPALPCVLLLDSMGELSRLFAVADVVFMGGTFPRRGGHNILEPAFFGRPVIAGPHMENFAAIAREFTEAGALVRIERPNELAPAIADLLDHPAAREAAGSRARLLASSKRGVTERLVKRLLDLYFHTLPLRPRGAVWSPLAALWERGAKRRRDHDQREARRLPQPVISIGGLSMGGTGKTPFADWLTAELKRQGFQPAILTRGYRRRSAEPSIIVPAGSRCPANRTGDEPQIYLHRGAAHLGIGADRYATATRLLESHPADVFVLDDGFQHWRLHRDMDIVLIDAMDPFGRGAVFPRGRLREPFEALKRASAFVITRVEPGLRTDAIERVLRRYNPAAPVFRSRVVPAGWLEVGTDRRLDTPPFRSAVAFCGLANPRTFWRSLESLGVDIRWRWAFGDHHRYRMMQMKRLVKALKSTGAEALVTTEKDAANLSPAALGMAAPVPVYALRIGIEIDDADGLIERILGTIGAALSRNRHGWREYNNRDLIV